MSEQINEQLFRNSDEFRNSLAELLKNNVLATALRIVEDSARPRRALITSPSVQVDTINHYNRIHGIQEAIDHLRRLATVPVVGEEHKQAIEDAIPFFHTLPESMQEAIRTNYAQNQG